MRLCGTRTNKARGSEDPSLVRNVHLVVLSYLSTEQGCVMLCLQSAGRPRGSIRGPSAWLPWPKRDVRGFGKTYSAHVWLRSSSYGGLAVYLLQPTDMETSRTVKALAVSMKDFERR